MSNSEISENHAQSSHSIGVFWRERSLLFDMIRRDFKLRYLGSVIGGYWSLLHPVAMIIIYSVIFSQVMEHRFPEGQKPQHGFTYTIYLCAGLLPWTSFAEAILRGTQVFNEYGNLIKKIAFPKDILSGVVAGSSGITLLISISCFIIMMALVSHPLGLNLFWFFPIFLCQMIFAQGLSLMLAICNVYFRDVQQLMSIVLQVWFWLTPVVYRIEQIPAPFHFIPKLNPFYYFVASYHEVFFLGTSPSMNHFVPMMLIAFVTFALGWYWYGKVKNELIDEL